MEKDLLILPYNSFLIPKGGRPVSSPKAKRLSRWGRFQLWFNTYRWGSYYWHERHPDFLYSKFFTFVVTINCIGLLLAILDGTC